MRTKGLTLLVLFGMLTISSFGQENEKRFGFELNSGASLATKKIGDASPKLGFGFEGVFHYRFMPHLGVYAGWGWNRFASDNSFAGNDVCFEETGYVFGFNFNHSIGNSPLNYYLRAGGLYNHIEIENTDGDIINDTGHGLGWQIAVGIDINLGSNWSLTPGLKFNSLSRETEFEGVSKDLDYQYLSARVGLNKNF